VSEPEKRFNPTSYLMDLKGKKYLPVNARIAAFREECSILEGWGLRTELLAGSLKEQFATFRAEVIDPQGRVVSVGTKTEDKAGFPDFFEKAETGSIGRALAAAGFGTLFALEFDEGEVRLTDSPITPKARAKAPAAGSPAGPVVCTICKDETKPIPVGRVSYCTQKSVPFTHFECDKG
jgi:hypothetical protein